MLSAGISGRRAMLLDIINKMQPQKSQNNKKSVPKAPAQPAKTVKAKAKAPALRAMPKVNTETAKKVLEAMTLIGNTPSHSKKEFKDHNAVQKPQYSAGNYNQPSDGKQVLSAWDRMVVAKNYPGQFDAPYVAGMNVCSVPTSTGRVATTFDQAFEFGGTGDVESKIGTKDYLVIAWSPSTTAFFGDGGPSNIPVTEKLGGFSIQ